MPSESRSVIRPPRDISSLAIAVRCPIRQRASVSYGVTSYVGPASRVNAVARYTPISCHRTHPDKIMTTTHPWAARDEPITTPIHFVIRLSLRRPRHLAVRTSNVSYLYDIYIYPVDGDPLIVPVIRRRGGGRGQRRSGLPESASKGRIASISS